MICPTFCAMHPLVACTFYPATSSISSWSFSITRDYSQTTWNAMNQLHTAQLAVHTRWMIPVSCWCLASCLFPATSDYIEKYGGDPVGIRTSPWLLYHPPGVPAPTVPWVVGTRCPNWEVAAGHRQGYKVTTLDMGNGWITLFSLSMCSWEGVWFDFCCAICLIVFDESNSSK